VSGSGENAVIAMSQKTYLCYTMMGKYITTPLAYDPLFSVSMFCSTRCGQNGMVAIADNTLRII